MKSASSPTRFREVRSTPGPRTLTWVTLFHLILISGFVLIPIWLKKKPEERFIEVVDLGAPDPAIGQPDASREVSAPPGPPTPAPNSPPAPVPAQQAKVAEPLAAPVQPPKAVPTAKPEPNREVATPSKPKPTTPPPPPSPSPPVREAKPKPAKPEPVKVATPKPTARPTDQTEKPSGPKPAPRQITVNTTLVKRTTGSEGSGTSAANTGPTTSHQTERGGGGLDPATIQKRLAAALPTVGVTAGTGQGRPGIVDASSYHALIRSTIERNWSKPTDVAPGREALVRVRIQPDGTVMPLGIFRSSGEASLDTSALEAVRKTSRLPRPLPDGLGNPDYEVVVNFKLD